MKTANNTVLITGGSAGIGFEIARILSEHGNQVIITGRNKERLFKAAASIPNATAIVSDVSDAADASLLAQKITRDFPSLNMVINNAGHALIYNMTGGDHAFEKAQEEMLTNYLSVIRLNEMLLPLLRKQQEAAIVNVSSIVAYVPGTLAGYSASKAALHSYTSSLRLALEDTPVKVLSSCRHW
ncbi:MAG TPA: SDR family NAD(P)-dependent oxidoreductase [Flavisolibacter sp.]|nr:SDR family NAD(P)-dependent oxidoreductase [Flavisolibacter sp.]